MDRRNPADRRRAARARRRRHRTIVLRWLGLVVVVAIAVAYVQPLRAYQHARTQVAERRAEVESLVRGNERLRKRLAETETFEFVEREARRLGLVRPGERLFIIKGIGKRDETRLR